MINKQLWSKRRLCIVFAKLVKIEIPLFMGWQALFIIILSLVFPSGVLRKNLSFLIIQSKILDQQNNMEKI